MATGSFTDDKDLHAAVKSFWWKLKMADEYLPATKLRSPKVQFFKATEGAGEAHGLGKDYGLGEVCEGEVVVHSIHGDHDTFIQGDSATSIAIRHHPANMSFLRNIHSTMNSKIFIGNLN